MTSEIYALADQNLAKTFFVSPDETLSEGKTWRRQASHCSELPLPQEPRPASRTGRSYHHLVRLLLDAATVRPLGDSGVQQKDMYLFP
ncbi:hypothetical protein BIW11_04305 [Tropilaelaps mercedesae]|uniref:Uncharacterized protein n=1 Tax=Tropilaelaps mercedesae TaxID=418985 RepID=A0A1V9X8M0_9ACAR|nr:hypothetical protein BIW11_04305 [Tropilaelaps mercedesae]